MFWDINKVEYSLTEGRFINFIWICFTCQAIAAFCATCVGLLIVPSYKKVVAVGMSILYILYMVIEIIISIVQGSYIATLPLLGVPVGVGMGIMLLYSGGLITKKSPD